MLNNNIYAEFIFTHQCQKTLHLNGEWSIIYYKLANDLISI